jgi:uncharacterized protein YdhG (YjbR/CyaY superfamily)
MSASKIASNSKGIDQYIRTEPAPVQKVLRALRSLIRKTAPEATEKLAWGMPTFYLHGNLIHFAAFKEHISIFPGSDAVAHFGPEARRHGLVCSKGTIQIPHAKPLPVQLVIRIVKYCVKRNLGDASSSGKKKLGTRLQRPKRPRNAMPSIVRTALLRSGLTEAFTARPPYQRNDYLGWIGQAAREETRQRRLAQMLHELRRGDKYMNMPYRGGTRKSLAGRKR